MRKKPKEEPPGRCQLWLRRLAGIFCLRRPRNLQDLTALLKRASQDDVLDRDLLAMIEGAFGVEDMRVDDIMIPRSKMKMIHKDATIAQILEIVTDGSHTRFPVFDEDPDKVTGVLHAKDLLRFFAENSDKSLDKSLDMNEYMRPPVIVPESKRVKVLLGEFRDKRSHMAIVVNEYAGVSGLVTIEDVLEQIVGDITDEHDVEEDDIYIFEEPKYGSSRVKAITPLDYFNKHFETDLSNGSADTIGGFVMNKFGRLPKRGETVEIAPFRFEVTRADGRRIHSLRVRKS